MTGGTETASAPTGPWWRPGTVTTIGSWPGVDPFEAARIIAGETPAMPALVELPDRGAGADLIGRTLALVPALPAEIVPSGWRFTASPGADHRRALSWLRQDLDAFEEAVHDLSAPVKVQVVGPLTLAAHVELASGERAISDHGARADIAEALAESVRDHVMEIRRRLSGAERVVVQIDEPSINAVLHGGVPTASGYRTYRAVDVQEATRSWRSVVEAFDGPAVLHSCAPGFRFDLAQAAGFAGLSFDASLISTDDYDAIAESIDRGTSVFLGVVPTTAPPAPARQYTDQLQRWWRDLGFPGSELAQRVVVTPACGLAGATPEAARRVVRTLRDIVGAVVEDPDSDHART